MAPAAQQEFTQDYLNTLNGFPTTAVASTKIADLDKTTVTTTSVRFIDLLQGTPIATPPVTPTISYDEDTDQLASRRRPRAGPRAAATPSRSSVATTA